MVTVHLWLTSNEGVGHSSLSVGERAYVSYWPGGGGADAKKDFKLKQTHEARWMSRLSVDVRLEGKSPDVSITITAMDEKAMEAAFGNLKSQAPSYNMRTHNCATPW